MNKMDNFFQEGSKWKFIYRFWHRRHHHLYPSAQCLYCSLGHFITPHKFSCMAFHQRVDDWDYNCWNHLRTLSEQHFFKLLAIILVTWKFHIPPKLEKFFFWSYNFFLKTKRRFCKRFKYIYHETLILKCETSKLLMHA